MATAALPHKSNGSAQSLASLTAEPGMRLLPAHSPPAEALDAVQRLAEAAEKAAHARFELMVHKATSKAQGVVDTAGDRASAIVQNAGLMAAAGIVALSSWIFLSVGLALALTPHVGRHWAMLIVGGIQLIGAGALFVVAKKSGAKESAKRNFAEDADYNAADIKAGAGKKP